MADPNVNVQPNSKFLLEIDGISIMSFEKCTIGASEWTMIENRTGTDGMFKNTSSGIKSVNTVTIEKTLREGGKEEVREMIDWHFAGSKDKRSGSIVLRDREDQELMRFNFKNTWISKFTPPELDANADNSPMLFQFELSVPEITLG